MKLKLVSVVCLLLCVFVLWAFYRPSTKMAIIRLEDVGPGGNYQTIDDLGKLRTVLEYLHSGQVPYQIAVISRWKSIQSNGSRYENGIDDENPKYETQQLISLLQQAQNQGAILGIHGYTHQYGDQVMKNDHQNSAIGNEFDVKDVPYTSTTEYAKDRASRALLAFKKVQFIPGFWETPHYHDTKEQEILFQSYFKIIYQGNQYNLKNLNSKYVPTPQGYIKNQQSVDGLIKAISDYDGVVSVFFHPFLEFQYLEPVKTENGQPLIKDGLPIYRYKNNDSLLHQLVKGINSQGYTWVSLSKIAK